MRKLFSGSIVLALLLCASLAMAASYGPAGAKFSIKAPAGWTESAMDGGVQVTNGKSALVLQIVENGGMTPAAFGDEVAKAAGLSDVQKEVDGDLVNINGKKDGTPIQLIISKLDDKFVLSAVLSGPDTEDMQKIIQSMQDE